MNLELDYFEFYVEIINVLVVFLLFYINFHFLEMNQKTYEFYLNNLNKNNLVQFQIRLV